MGWFLGFMMLMLGISAKNLGMISAGLAMLAAHPLPGM